MVGANRSGKTRDMGLQCGEKTIGEERRLGYGGNAMKCPNCGVVMMIVATVCMFVALRRTMVPTKKC